jgi:hypothetical protein
MAVLISYPTLFRLVVVEGHLNSASIASARNSNGRMSAVSLGPAHWWHVFFDQAAVVNAVKTALYSRQFYTESITLAHHISRCLYLYHSSHKPREGVCRLYV